MLPTMSSVMKLESAKNVSIGVERQLLLVYKKGEEGGNSQCLSPHER